jgi:hypothetical protein
LGEYGRKGSGDDQENRSKPKGQEIGGYPPITKISADEELATASNLGNLRINSLLFPIPPPRE